MMRRPLLVAILAALPVFGVLVALGTWQLQRMQWKNDILARIAASEAAPAEPLREPPEPFHKVRATGRFDHGRDVSLGVEVRGTVLGTHLVTPLVRQGAAPVLVDRGWVPLERGAAVDRPPGEVTIEAWVRPAERGGIFAAADDPARRLFYTFDTAAIGAALGLPEVAPYGLVVLGAGNGTLPDPARTLPRPTNSHLGYAITWYGLALSLLGVLGAYALRRKDA